MPNAWVEHVRKFASKNNMSYGCAVSNAECKASYHKQKARNAKKTRTPAQEMEGMGAEDVNVAEKPKPKPKKLKPLTSDERAELITARKKLAKAKLNKFKTRDEKIEYSRLQDVVERLSPRESVAPKAVKQVLDNFDLLKKISGFVRKPIVYDEDDDLQAIAYARRALDTIEMIASDADIKVSKAFMAHLSDRMELVNYNQYEKYKHMTEDELKPMYDAEQDFELYEGTLEEIADDYGMDIKFSDDGNYKLIRARLNKSNPKGILPWLYDFITEQKKDKKPKK
jgi:hypothetical protein